MRAMVLRRPASANAGPLMLESADVDTPKPATGEILVRVSVCGVCRTDLDVVEGRVVAPRYPVIPGHQIVGRVVGLGPDVTEVHKDQRVGIAWIHSACGVCRWCRSGEENLCPSFESTGCDANGGYAEFTTVPTAFAQTTPHELTDSVAAPLLCAGAIGWRSLR